MMRIHGIPIGWSPYSMGHAVGLKADPTGQGSRETAFDLLARAVKHGLAGVEIPYKPFLLELGDDEVHALVRSAKSQGLFLQVAASGYTAEALREPIEAAAKIGARVIRTVIGGTAMGGDRRLRDVPWTEFMGEVARGLAEVVPIARASGVRVGIENHQDVSSEDLLTLINSTDPEWIGVTFDVGNALATVEHPVAFARKMVSHIVNIHIKDYVIYQTREGYNLVRCPIGSGVVDFDAVLGSLSRSGCGAAAVVELGATAARAVPCLVPEYWDHFPPRSAKELASVLGFAYLHARPLGADWRTPAELEAPHPDVVQWELAEFEESVAWLRRLADPRGAVAK